MKYRKKPIVIEAFQWVGDDRPGWFHEAVEEGNIRFGDDSWDPGYGRYMEISTPEGTMTARPGDWIIKGVEGELYPCKDSIFQKTYEPEGPVTYTAVMGADGDHRPDYLFSIWTNREAAVAEACRLSAIRETEYLGITEIKLDNPSDETLDFEYPVACAKDPNWAANPA